MLGVGSHQLAARYPGDPSFGASQRSYTYDVTQAQGVIEDFFLIGDTVANTQVQLAAQVGFANLGFTPYGGTITVSDLTSGVPIVLGKGKVDSSLYGGYWTVTVTVPTPGTNTLRLDYSGDNNVKGVSQTCHEGVAIFQKPIAITVRATSVAGTTPKNGTLALTKK